MITLGIFTADNLTTITGAIEQMDGQTEKEIVGVACADPFAALAAALADCRMVKAQTMLRMYTNDAQLLKFLAPPISIAPTQFKEIKGWGKVGWGGNLYQWEILHGLFAFDRWQIRQASKLPGTEIIYHEYRNQTAARPGATACARRLYEGVWTGA
jgi:hypothetical protein